MAEQITEEDFTRGLIYPAVQELQEVSVNVAVRIAETVFASGLAGVERPKNIRKFIEKKIYRPVYG